MNAQSLWIWMFYCVISPQRYARYTTEHVRRELIKIHDAYQTLRWDTELLLTLLHVICAGRSMKGNTRDRCLWRTSGATTGPSRGRGARSPWAGRWAGRRRRSVSTRSLKSEYIQSFPCFPFSLSRSLVCNPKLKFCLLSSIKTFNVDLKDQGHILTLPFINVTSPHRNVTLTIQKIKI